MFFLGYQYMLNPISPFPFKIHGRHDDCVPPNITPGHDLGQVMHEEVSASYIHGWQVEIQHTGFIWLKDKFNKYWTEHFRIKIGVRPRPSVKVSCEIIPVLPLAVLLGLSCPDEAD